MDEVDLKICPNCKREIPAVNFTTHTVFCERNIRVCPVCKEPVPQAELQYHHEQMHKLMPCKQCGESVCGTDLEDHIRDSCAHTMKCCKFCLLELRRSSMPSHERYCGARTEQCSDCGEWVMHKYRQLHLDSNHGFIRLDDDPVPIKNDSKTTNVPKPVRTEQPPNGGATHGNASQPTLHIRHFPSFSSFNIPSSAIISPPPSTSKTIAPSSAGPSSSSRSTNTVAISIRPPSNPLADRTNQPANVLGANEASSSTQNGAIPRVKRTNDQPQVNIAVVTPDKVKKDLWASRGAVKKRPAPKPPLPQQPSPQPRLLPALPPPHEQRWRQALEGHRRHDDFADLPPGTYHPNSLAAQIEKMRQSGNRSVLSMMNTLDNSSNSPSRTGRPGASRGRGSRSRSPENVEEQVRRNDLKDLKPMTPEEFVDRFNELQLRQPGEERRGEERRPGEEDRDRFSQIKCSLRELRRGLNEVTAPYNVNANNETPQSAVRLPCEFCGAPVPADDLVQHQTGCRPDLARYRPGRAERADRPERAERPERPDRSAEPAVLIPCEFCAEPQPVYLLSEHQEQCGGDEDMLYPD